MATFSIKHPEPQGPKCLFCTKRLTPGEYLMIIRHADWSVPERTFTVCRDCYHGFVGALPDAEDAPHFFGRWLGDD